MANQLLQHLSNQSGVCFTDGELEALLGGSTDSRYGLLKRSVQKNELIHIRRGLYCLSSEQPHPFELAQKIYAPSYISLESALSYHQLIPEAVRSVTSVCVKRAKEFNTPLGVFSYQRVPAHDFFIEVERVESEQGKFLLAKPWKAISDYIFCYKKDWVGIKPLINSLRIEEESFPLVSLTEISLLNEYYKSKRVTKFLKGLRRDLRL